MWIEKEKTRTRIDAEDFKFDEQKEVWLGTPTTSDNPHSFRINVATTTSVDKKIVWDDKSTLGFIQDKADKKKLSWKDFIKQGFMIDENDFRNFEATIYWRVVGNKWKQYGCIDKVGNPKPDQMTIYGRGSLHGKNWPAGCLGCCYKGSLDYNNVVNNKKEIIIGPGSGYFEKEYHHFEGSTGYAQRILQEKSTFALSGNPQNLLGTDHPADLESKWIGEKFFVYDTNEKLDDKDLKNLNAVRCEIWIDKNAEQSINDSTKQDWQLMNVFIDRGDKFPPKDENLRNQMVEKCDAVSETQVFAWGGPLVSFRIDCADVQIKYASIREIEIPKNDLPTP